MCYNSIKQTILDTSFRYFFFFGLSGSYWLLSITSYFYHFPRKCLINKRKSEGSFSGMRRKFLCIRFLSPTYPLGHFLSLCLCLCPPVHDQVLFFFLSISGFYFECIFLSQEEQWGCSRIKNLIKSGTGHWHTLRRARAYSHSVIIATLLNFSIIFNIRNSKMSAERDFTVTYSGRKENTMNFFLFFESLEDLNIWSR